MPLSPQSVGMILLAGLLMSIVGTPSGASGQGLRHFREGREATSELPHPELFFAFNNRGNVHAAKRDYDRTLADYSEALRLNPKYAGAMRNRGIVYARKRDDERAILDYSEAARLDPDDPHALIGRAFLYCEKHEFERAVRDFDAALSICPTCPRAVSGRAAASIGNECR